VRVGLWVDAPVQPVVQPSKAVVAELSLQIAGGPDAPSVARLALRRSSPDLPRELMQVVILLASELVSNAVKHARAEVVTVRFTVAPEQLRLEVGDEGTGFSPPGDVARDPEDEGGWGLYLVDEMSTRWGVDDGEGTRVWLEIDR
jgi:anti-sigma regulatory factor (Ser/Thr protein kinase)